MSIIQKHPPMPALMPTVATGPASIKPTLTSDSEFISPVTCSSQSDTFNPHDEDSWFFGFMSRADAADMLSGNNDVGAFLVRESTTAKGDLVLSVKENNEKISHYIINRWVLEKSNQIRFKIGDHIFPDIPALLTFYKTNNLDDSPLSYPAVPKTNCQTLQRRSFTRDYLAEAYNPIRLTSANNSQENKISSAQRKLPCKAVVIQSRVPNAYDKTALTLNEGQIVLVTKTNISGCWEGEVDGKSGHFPFNYVKFIDESLERKIS